MKIAELKIKVPDGRVIGANVMPDGCCVLTVEMATPTAETADNIKLEHAVNTALYNEMAKYGISREEGKEFLDELEDLINCK